MKLRIKILLVLVVMILVGVVIIVLPHTGSKRAVEKYKSELLAKGEKLTFKDWAPAMSTPTPDAAKMFTGMKAVFVSISNSTPIMQFISPGHALVTYQQGAFEANGRTNIWPVLIAEVETNRSNLLELREIAQAPILFYNLDYSQGYLLTLPHLARMKAAEQLASASTIVALHEQNFPEAWTNLISAVNLVKIYQAEPILISQLVKVSMARIAMSTTWEALQSEHWTDAQLSDLQGRWQGMDLFEQMEPTMGMERADTIDALSQGRKSYITLANMFSGTASGISSSPVSLDEMIKDAVERYPKYWAWKSSWSYKEELYSMKTMQSIVECCRAAKATGALMPALKEHDSRMIQINKQVARVSQHFLIMQGDGPYRPSLVKCADTENAKRLLVTAIALKRYHLRNGKYPPELKELVPEFLEKVPIDFMDGKPLRYQLKPNNEFLLYSVGEDGEDNGGDATPTEPAMTRNKNWLKARDMVWPQPATAEEITAARTNSATKINTP